MYDSIRLRLRDEIMQSMVNYVVARGRMNDVRPGSGLLQVLMSTAITAEQVYLQFPNVIAAFALDRNRGEDLVERAKDYDMVKTGATRATGYVYFSRNSTSGTVPIALGTRVARSVNPTVAYRTTAAGSILAGATNSALIPIEAEVAGADGYAEPGTIVRLLSTIAGINSVTNPTATTPAVDAQSDQAFIQAIKDSWRGKSTATPRALEGLSRSVTLDSGVRVFVSKIVEWADEPGRAYLYVDDGAGTINTYQAITTTEVLVAAALGNERRFQTSRYPIREDGPFVLVLDLGLGTERTLVRGTDYQIREGGGEVHLLLGGYRPTGLVAGESLSVTAYDYYTGLIPEVQWRVNGRGSSPAIYSGWGGAASFITVRPALPIFPDIECVLVVKAGYARAAVIAAVTTAIVEYLNSLNINEPLYHAELTERIMGVAGMLNVAIVAPVDDVYVPEFKVIRALAANIQVS